MSPKRLDRAAPPAIGGEHEVIFATNEAAKGWDELCNQVPEAAHRAWSLMRTSPAPKVANGRHHQLKGSLGTASHQGKTYPQWQIEVTGGGRLWYLHDEARKTCWIRVASCGHPWQTD